MQEQYHNKHVFRIQPFWKFRMNFWNFIFINSPCSIILWIWNARIYLYLSLLVSKEEILDRFHWKIKPTFIWMKKSTHRNAIFSLQEISSRVYRLICIRRRLYSMTRLFYLFYHRPLFILKKISVRCWFVWSILLNILNAMDNVWARKPFLRHPYNFIKFCSNVLLHVGR